MLGCHRVNLTEELHIPRDVAKQQFLRACLVLSPLGRSIGPRRERGVEHDEELPHCSTTIQDTATCMPARNHINMMSLINICRIAIKLS
jgi:hypothetical protein